MHRVKNKKNILFISNELLATKLTNFFHYVFSNDYICSILTKNSDMIYFDHAATTSIRPEVIEEMTQVMKNCFGNPSSTHGAGREAKNLIELSRKQIAKLLGAQAKEILFSSGGTESNNWVINQCVSKLGVKRIITSRIEHHAVLYPIQYLEKAKDIKVDYVNILADGQIDLIHLSEILPSDQKTLVSLMAINNETGTITDIKKVAELCHTYQTLFHSDMVQFIGKYPVNLTDLGVDFATASAHKFYGPKGIGLLYVNHQHQIGGYILGGEQEKGQRAGTESTHQIVGMSKALEISLNSLAHEKSTIAELKNYAIEQIKTIYPKLRINAPLGQSAYNILNIGFELTPDKVNMLLFHLDLKGISVSRGSACQSGSSKPSHVLCEFLNEEQLNEANMRLSFCHTNTKAEIDALVDALKGL
jgi:cysteine desulfurase